MNLSDWTQANSIDGKMLFKNAARATFSDFEAFAKILGGEATVIGTHQSKSCTLPVVEIVTDYVTVVMRNNFHDVKISVEIAHGRREFSTGFETDLFGLFAGGDSYLGFCEGFPPGRVHPGFALGANRFTTSVSSETRFMSIARALHWYFNGQRIEEIADDVEIQTDIKQRLKAAEAQFPVLSEPSRVSALIRFLDLGYDIAPNYTKLREIMTRQDAKWDGTEDPTPLSYLHLDFSAGVPRPMRPWLAAIDTVIRERREDKEARRGDGAEVGVTRLPAEAISLAKAMGATELIRGCKYSP